MIILEFRLTLVLAVKLHFKGQDRGAFTTSRRMANNFDSPDLNLTGLTNLTDITMDTPIRQGIQEDSFWRLNPPQDIGYGGQRARQQQTQNNNRSTPVQTFPTTSQANTTSIPDNFQTTVPNTSSAGNTTEELPVSLVGEHLSSTAAAIVLRGEILDLV